MLRALGRRKPLRGSSTASSCQYPARWLEVRGATVEHPVVPLQHRAHFNFSLALGPALTALALLGCSKTVGEQLIPEVPRMHEVRAQEHVTAIARSGEPLIVDWEPEARADLEVQMQDGVTVVAYSAEGLRLLKDCTAPGSYGFVQVSPKEQLIVLESKDEVSANLPASAAAMVHVGGEAGRQRAIEIAMKIVGKFRTTRRFVDPRMLRGSCQGATHFVRGAMVGAFAMRSHVGAYARTAAEIFEARVGGGAEGEKAVENRDGDPARCAAESRDVLLDGCGALLRLELAPVGGPEDQASVSDDPAQSALDSGCPRGLVNADGKCTAASKDEVHTCRPEEPGECEAQCNAGSARSCVIAGVEERGTAGDAEAPKRALELFDRACKEGDTLGCTLLGDAFRFGAGVPRDVLKAGALYGRGCDDGVPAACTQLGTMYYYGDGLTPDLARAAALYGRGCDAGDERACSLLGDLHLTAAGDLHDPARAVSLFARACEGDDLAGCIARARAIEFGIGVTADVPEAIAEKHRLCDRHPAACGQLGVDYLAGRGVGTHEEAARRLFARACAALPPKKPADAWGEADLYAFYACLVAEERFGAPGASTEQKYAMAARVRGVLPLVAARCKEDAVFECYDGGYLTALTGEPEKARELWKSGCTWNSTECCDALEASVRKAAAAPLAPTAAPSGAAPAPR